MGSLDGPNATSSLGQRRQAASNLPQFELPPPSNLQLAAQHYAHKFPPLSIGGHGHAPPAVSVGNLLTPPSNSASESGASSGTLPTGTTPNGHAMPVLPYTPGFWGSGTTPGFQTGLTPQPWHGNPLYSSRSMFSPGPGTLMRHNSNSPTAGEAASLPPPPYELNSMNGYPTSMGLASPAIGAHTSAHHLLSNMMPGRPSSITSPISPHDGTSRPSSTPGHYAPLSASQTPQPPQYGFSTSTPVSQSPHHNNALARISPPVSHGPIPQVQPQSHFIKPPYPSYSLPAMPGPIMTNVQSPGSQMSMVGNLHQANMLPMAFNSGYAANPQAMYAQQRANSPAQGPVNDRPFKCDQCPQSFNRNHDLKRHKRIHLAVKPFPCKHCDKSFSRKDALKRHILVKGCGNSNSNDNGDGSKSDSGSDNMNGDISQVSVSA